jgi:hypothetical protein
LIYETLVPENLREVRERIAEAALRGGRAPEAVRLVAVSKLFPPEAVLAAWEAGQRDFGENRPEQGAEKIPQVAALLDGERPVWHMIGHIQSRKSDMVVEHFDWVHAVDRHKIARYLSRLADEAGRELPVLFECNVSGEESKYGYDLAGWQEDAATFERFCEAVERVVALPALRIEGLMTMAPIADDPESVRPVFASLRALRDALRERFPNLSWRHLSMGMTDDFEVAVEEGATLVRVGRGIFGSYAPT